MAERCIYLSTPAVGQMMTKEAARAAFWEHGAPCRVIDWNHVHTSLLANCFNADWAMALATAERGKCTHFAMLHADMAAEPGWLGLLFEEMEATGAEVLSAVAAVKDSSGDTNCAVGPLDDWFAYRRLHFLEIQHLPESFSAADFPHDDCLLVNTGCLLVDIRGDWCRKTDEGGFLECYFTIRDRVFRGDDGKYRVDVAPEDWNFSRMAAAQGCRVMATRRVKTIHRGIKDFPNWAGDQ